MAFVEINFIEQDTCVQLVACGRGALPAPAPAALAVPAGGKVHSVSLVSFFHAQTTPPGHPDIYQPERTYVQVVAIDANREYYELGRPVIEKAGVAHKVDFREGDGIAELDEILSEDDGAMAGAFDFAYADADKLQYAGFIPVVADVETVEAMAMQDGLNLANNLGFKRIKRECDSLSVVNHCH
ncbi:Caffeoyl-CoA O-methyltransferase [Hordeum vulgare]|nr:Caffeoyl-CoA O-methyltransferase [Hordeum vulgare]KAE8813875.1 Caffeoyl-CoA O-methyltransferase [Hordeum vulgare]